MSQKKPNKVLISVLISGVFVLFLWAVLSPRKIIERPNIVFLLADTLRPDFLGCYGFPDEISPHIDDIAKNGVVFENAVAQAPWTKPSVASIMTSLYPNAHRVLDHEDQFQPGLFSGQKTDILPNPAVTLAELLKRNGYRTEAYIDDHPWMTREMGFAQGFDVFEQKDFWKEIWMNRALVRNLFAQHKSKPFFYYFHFLTTHGPYNPQTSDMENLEHSAGLGDPIRLTEEQVNSIPYYILQDARFPLNRNKRDLRTWKRLYAAQIPSLDKMVGHIMRELDNRNLMKNTIVIFASDHGEGFYEHGEMGHGRNLHWEMLKVPLVIRLPKKLRKGTRIKNLVRLVDLMPTLLDATRSDRPRYQLQGRSFLNLLLNNKPRSPLYSYATGVYGRPGQIAVQNSAYKLILDSVGTGKELFELKTDPFERINTASSNGEMTANLEGKIEAHLETAGLYHKIIKEEAGKLDSTLIERLKALGYVN